jgi:hypothetical protein
MTEHVALYGMEMYPLISEAKEKGVLTEEDLETAYGNILTFVETNGSRIEDEERIVNDLLEGDRDPSEATKAPVVYMAIYRELQMIEQKLGMGIGFKEDKRPAQI